MIPNDNLPPGSAPRLADFIIRNRAVILIVTLCVTLFGVWRVTKLHLKTSFAELLPKKDPAVVVMEEMAGRINGISHITIAVEGPSPEANKRFVDDLVPRIKALGLKQILSVEYGVHEERRFFEKHKFLYPRLEQLEDARDELRRAILKRKNPAFVDLSEGSGKEDTFAKKKAELEKKDRELLERFPDGYFATKDRLRYAVVVRLDGSFFSERMGEDVARVLKNLVAEMQPSRYHPQMTVGYTGDVMTQLEERQALEDDLVLATTVCTVLIGLVIFLFFGRLRSLPFAVTPAVLGVIVALTFAQLAFGSLNASTAFMGSIIVGNGINYAIIQMARYEEERRAGRRVRESIAIAIGTTWRATLIASMGAAIAYGSLAITTFRGFNQFGWIGGVGMLSAWAFTVLSLPAAWSYLDRRPEGAAPRIKGFGIGPIARLTVTRPGLILGLGAALTVAAIIPLPHYLKDPFEYYFRKLGNQLSQTGSGATAISRRLDPIFGRSLTPNFVIAPDASHVEEIRRKLRERDRNYNVLGDIRTINDFLPGTPKEQAEKLDVLAEIRNLIDKNIALLDEKEREQALKLRPPDDLRIVLPADLPMSIRRYFTERDGTIGRPIAYYARQGITVWDGRVQMKLAEVTQELRLDNGQIVRSSGKPAIFAGIIRSIIRDGPIATAAALLGVAILLVVLTYRRGGWWLVLGVLVVGVVWMVGCAAIFDVRVNFLNFIALPITFGINVDYGINLLLRAQLEGRGRIRQAVEATGAAVTLCSLTTIIGYGALLVADNRALRSFGAMAIIGEFACLAAALLLLPAALVLLERRATKGPRPEGRSKAQNGTNGYEAVYSPPGREAPSAPALGPSADEGNMLPPPPAAATGSGDEPRA